MMRMRGLLAVAVLLGAAATLPAADGPVPLRGRVVDAVSGAPVPGADIVAGEAREVTDSEGAFSLSLAPGDWTLTFGAAGYIEQSRRVILVTGPAPGPVE